MRGEERSPGFPKNALNERFQRSLTGPVQFFELCAKECFAGQDRAVRKPDLLRLP
jgi:hypothetical protein